MTSPLRHVFVLICCLPIISFGQDSLAVDTTSHLERTPDTLDALATMALSNFQLVADEGTVKIHAPGVTGPVRFQVNGTSVVRYFDNGIALLATELTARGNLYFLRTAPHEYHLYHLAQYPDGGVRIRRIPLWLSVVPPLIAIALALVFREVVVSLFVGIWAGAFIAGGLRIDSFYYFFQSFFDVIVTYLIEALSDTGHLSVIVFSLLIGGMVAVISRNGGMAGVVKLFSRFAKGPRSAQFITWLMGVAIFFDDYANTLIVGNTMRSVTDRFRVSREKLAYIVDATAAPVAAVAFITTWIGAELGYIDSGMAVLEHYPYEQTPYAIFLHSLKYSFYPILTLGFMLFLIFSQRDYGPMWKAEYRARTTGRLREVQTEEVSEQHMQDLTPVKRAPRKWYHAFFPVLTVIVVTILGLADTGLAAARTELLDAGVPIAEWTWSAIWRHIGPVVGVEDTLVSKLGYVVGLADAYVALLWASLSGITLAILMTLYSRIMRLGDAMHTMISGLKTMIPAVVILALAWSLAATTKDLHTAHYLSLALKDSINPLLMPMIVFVLAAFISFSTGSSWSTMAILYPIAIPTTWHICLSQGIDPQLGHEIVLNVISVVLGASVLGDHCSPISDTTILSSLASDCHHIDHVRTQLPYALTVGAVAMICGGLSTCLGGGWTVSLLLMAAGMVCLWGVVRAIGKPVPLPTGAKA